MTKEEYERCVQMAHYGRIDDPEIDLMRQALLHAHAENERLREALKPFAELGAEIGDGVIEGIIWKDDLRIEGAKAYRDGKDYYITVGDLRRAALGVTG